MVWGQAWLCLTNTAKLPVTITIVFYMTVQITIMLHNTYITETSYLYVNNQVGSIKMDNICNDINLSSHLGKWLS